MNEPPHTTARTMPTTTGKSSANWSISASTELIAAICQDLGIKPRPDGEPGEPQLADLRGFRCLVAGSRTDPALRLAPRIEKTGPPI